MAGTVLTPVCLIVIGCFFLVPLCDAYCYNNGGVRLVGGSDSHAGRVEICHDNVWGTVCDDSWDNDDARVVCRQLGYSSSGAIAYTNAYYGEGSGQIWLDEVRCSGTEYSLGSCSKNSYGDHDCGHSEDAGVSCGSSYCTNGDLRLRGGSNYYEGRVEICHNGIWGTICDSGWDSSDAKVVCRQLGLPTIDAVSYHNSYFGAGSGQTWLTNVDCYGYESKLDFCYHNSYGSAYCSHFDEAGVQCSTSNPIATTSYWSYCTNGDLRLSGSSNYYEGRVEICHNNQWGTICSSGWDSNDARVVCRQLGFYDIDAVSHRYGYFGAGSGRTWLTSVNCNGYESRLDDCSHSSYGSAYCSHYDDAGVTCLSTYATTSWYCYDGDVRLVGDRYSYSYNEGRVEVCQNNQWGTICDDGWDNDDAKVVCQQLGFTTQGATAYSNAHFGQGSGQILFSNVNCYGYESHLTNCYHSSYTSSCSHWEDAGVRCGRSSSGTNCQEGHNNCGIFYGSVIGGAIAGMFLLVCVPITIISVVACISKRKRRAVRVTRVNRTQRSTGQSYRRYQQYPPPTTTVVSASNQTSNVAYSGPVPFYQFQQSGTPSGSFVSTEHAQLEQVPNEDPPPYAESDPLSTVGNEQTEGEADERVDDEAPLIVNDAGEDNGGHQLEIIIPSPEPPSVATGNGESDATAVVVKPDVQSSSQEKV